jgi:hypothetical protein
MSIKLGADAEVFFDRGDALQCVVDFFAIPDDIFETA